MLLWTFRYKYLFQYVLSVWEDMPLRVKILGICNCILTYGCYKTFPIVWWSFHTSSLFKKLSKSFTQILIVLSFGVRQQEFFIQSREYWHLKYIFWKYKLLLCRLLFFFTFLIVSFDAQQLLFVYFYLPMTFIIWVFFCL